VDTQWADSRYVSIKRTDDQYALEYMNSWGNKKIHLKKNINTEMVQKVISAFEQCRTWKKRYQPPYTVFDGLFWTLQSTGMGFRLIPVGMPKNRKDFSN